MKKHWQKGGIIAIIAYSMHMLLHVMMPVTAMIEAATLACMCAYCAWRRRNER